ncbi:MAG: RIP metalloprotease, partial [Phycisphaerales bacterium]|nr:RIP metalloprotease [Phycisphaerales bacterium]
NIAQRVAMVANWPSAPMVLPGQAPGVSTLLPTPSGALAGIAAGSRIVSVNGQPVATMADVWKALRAAARQTPDGEDLTVSVGHQRVLANATSVAPLEVTKWTIRGRVEAPVASAGPTEVQQLRALKWTGPVDAGFYEPLMTKLHADTIPGAMAMGLRQTQTAMTQTYLTFARLFQGSIKVEHLRGPVGIAHVGTLLAGRGFIWLVFFMAIISVNLAVVNFLPLPIVDGGHFIFLLYEQITGRAVSVAVQNVATIAGLLMIASMFLLVTYHDVVRLFTGG